MSVTCTTLRLGVPQVAWGNLWSIFQGKGRDVKGEQRPGSGPVTAQYFRHLSRKYFLCIGRRSPCSENRVENYTAVLLCMQQPRTASRRAWVGLGWILASAVAAHTSHLQASQSLQATAAL